MSTSRRCFLVNSSLAVIAIAAVVASVFIGAGGFLLPDAIAGSERARDILLQARLPRAILAAFVGMALGSGGAAYQALLRNPLADPFILGVSGGAALGSVVAVGLRLPYEAVPLAAFLGAICSMAIIHIVAGSRDSIRLLLTGVVFNAFSFALILFINAVVTMEQAYQIIFLLIGNLDAVDPIGALTTGLFVATGFCILCTQSGKMNLISMGDADAESLGINVRRARTIIFLAASLMVGAAVAASGLIGFVGLFIPHAVRLVFGSDHRLSLPASGFIGAAFLVLADSTARTVLMHSHFATELPVGVITALVGAPMFLILLKRQRPAS